MIIVTGGAGFIGSNLVRALNERGCTDILLVDCVENVDQISNRAKKSLIPLFWDVAVELQSASEREEALYKDALLAGYSKGVAIPVHCGHTVLAIMMLYNTDLPFSEKEKNLASQDVKYFVKKMTNNGYRPKDTDLKDFEDVQALKHV